MADLSLFFNPKKTLKRADVIKMGETISREAKNKKIKALTITITDDLKDGANSIMFPFKIVE